MARITKPVEERRLEIIDTARKLFLENGFDKTQVADISRKMNVASGLVYHYFKSKTEIFCAVIDELSKEEAQKTKRFLSSATGSAFDRLKLLFTSIEDTETQKGLIYSVATDPVLFEYCRQQITNSTLPILISLIEQGNKDGSWNIEFPKEIAIFILQGAVGIISLTQEPESSLQAIEKKKGILINILFRALGVTDSP